MSAVTWTTESSRQARPMGARPRAIARRLGFGAALVMATGTAYAAMLLAVLMASSIIQF